MVRASPQPEALGYAEDDLIEGGEVLVVGSENGGKDSSVSTLRCLRSSSANSFAWWIVFSNRLFASVRLYRSACAWSITRDSESETVG